MKMPAPTETSDYAPAPAGNHLAVSCRLIDLGTQQTSYQGKPKRQRKIYLEWQLPGERTADGLAVTVGNRYTLSSSEKATLRKHLESWRGRRFENDELAGFDLRNILGKPCLLSIVQSTRDGKTYADVANVAALPKGTTPAATEGSTVYLSLEPDDFEPAIYESLSDKLKETIAASPEFQALSYQADGQAANNVDDTSDIPF